ncbi:MAG: RodZ domain-containing protein [Ignavibacteriaceae bacterium]
MFANLSEELKTKRESLGLSLDQIARKIRIDIKFLRAMENGDFSFLPDLYIKAYLKEFAGALNLDEGIIIQKYNLAKEGKEYLPEMAVETVAAAPKNIARFADAEKEQVRSETLHLKTVHKNQIVFGLISVFGLIVLIYFIFFTGETEEIIRETPYEEILEENKNRYEETSQVNEEITSDSLVLSFNASDSCWIKVVLDEAVAKEYFLFPKQSLVIKAKDSFNLVLGNYRSVVLTVNEKTLKLEDQKGSVAKITIDRNGVRPLVFKD